LTCPEIEKTFTDWLPIGLSVRPIGLSVRPIGLSVCPNGLSGPNENKPQVELELVLSLVKRNLKGGLLFHLYLEI
jgi:hypothetical protein